MENIPLRYGGLHSVRCCGYGHVKFCKYFVKVYRNSWLFRIANGDSGSHLLDVGIQSSQRVFDYWRIFFLTQGGMYCSLYLMCLQGYIVSKN